MQEVLVLGMPAVQGAAFGARDLLRREEDRLEQAVEILLARERDADLVEFLESRQEVVEAALTRWCIQTGTHRDLTIPVTVT